MCLCVAMWRLGISLGYHSLGLFHPVFLRQGISLAWSRLSRTSHWQAKLTDQQTPGSTYFCLSSTGNVGSGDSNPGPHPYMTNSLTCSSPTEPSPKELEEDVFEGRIRPHLNISLMCVLFVINK